MFLNVSFTWKGCATTLLKQSYDVWRILDMIVGIITMTTLCAMHEKERERKKNYIGLVRKKKALSGVIVSKHK